MSDALGRMKDEVARNPATDRLKAELQHYLQARAQHAVTGLGERLGRTVQQLGDPSQGGPGGLLGGLAKGGSALAEGKSPAKAVMTAGASTLKDTVKDKAKSLLGRGKSGGGKSKSVTIVEDIDVGVPVREAYNQWTQYQEFSTFAKGVVSVETSDDTSSNWKVKVAKCNRSWTANVTEQVPDERISWTTEGAKGTVKGVVTFHSLGDSLTRVLLVLKYFPKGFFEKTGNIWRAQGRRARLDLKLYRTFIMQRGEATDGWRGEIRDGEVVTDHETALEEEERDTDAQDDESDAEPEAADEDDVAVAGNEGTHPSLEDSGAQDEDADGEREDAEGELAEEEPEDLEEDLEDDEELTAGEAEPEDEFEHDEPERRPRRRARAAAR